MSDKSVVKKWKMCVISKRRLGRLRLDVVSSEIYCCEIGEFGDKYQNIKRIIVHWRRYHSSHFWHSSHEWWIRLCLYSSMIPVQCSTSKYQSNIDHNSRCKQVLVLDTALSHLVCAGDRRGKWNNFWMVFDHFLLFL